MARNVARTRSLPDDRRCATSARADFTGCMIRRLVFTLASPVPIFGYGQPVRQPGRVRLAPCGAEGAMCQKRSCATVPEAPAGCAGVSGCPKRMPGAMGHRHCVGVSVAQARSSIPMTVMASTGLCCSLEQPLGKEDPRWCSGRRQAARKRRLRQLLSAEIPFKSPFADGCDQNGPKISGLISCARGKNIGSVQCGLRMSGYCNLAPKDASEGEKPFYDERSARRAASGSLLMICSKAAAGPLIRRCPCSHFR